MKLSEETITEGLRTRVSLSGNRIACIFDDISYTWQELDLISDSVAEKLINCGIKQYMHVGILGVNTIEWLVSYFAVLKTGAVAVLLNYNYLEEELCDVIAYADVEVVLTGEAKNNQDYQAVVNSIRSRLPLLQVAYEMSSLVDQAIKNIRSCVSQKSKIHIQPHIKKTDTALIIFTSGTTLRPKGVVLSHGQIMHAMGCVADVMAWNENDRLLLALPMYHGSGANCGILAALHSGMSMVLMRFYRSVPVMAMIDKYQCTVLNAVPSMLLLMINNPEFKQYKLSSLRSGTISGSSITKEQYLKILDQIPFEHLIPAYGMTETSTLNTICGFNEPTAIYIDTVGKPMDGVELRIWNCREALVAENGEVGEIQIRGRYVTEGYYNMPQKTEESMLQGGWFRTGDAGFIDNAGRLHFRNRISEMIIRGGENIAPLEIESCIQSYSEDIDTVKVVGIPDDIMQEEVAAAITMHNGKIHQSDLLQFLRSKLAAFKIPKYIIQIESFPMTGSGKIDLKKLKKIVEAQIAGKE